MCIRGRKSADALRKKAFRNLFLRKFAGAVDLRAERLQAKGERICVLVQHGNYFSFYCKLKSTSVKAGDKVKTGQKIGTVDTINGETKLHFQIWQNQKPQNPELWLR